MRSLMMRIHALIVGCAAGAFLLGTSAQAQQPTPTPPPDYGAPITLDQAKEAAAAAQAEAKKNGWRMAIAVVDPGGYLVYFERSDGSQNASVALAEAKARTSALFRRPSKVFADQFAAGNTGFMSSERGASDRVGRRHPDRDQRQADRRDRSERGHRAAGRGRRDRRGHCGEMMPAGPGPA